MEIPCIQIECYECIKDHGLQIGVLMNISNKKYVLQLNVYMDLVS